MAENYTIYFKDGLERELEIAIYYTIYERERRDEDYEDFFEYDEDYFIHRDLVPVQYSHILKCNYDCTEFTSSIYYGNKEVREKANTYQKEIFDFCKRIEPGQKVEDGVIKVDTDNPVVTIEKIDAMFQKCKQIQFHSGFREPYFICGDPEMEKGMEYGYCVMLLTVANEETIVKEKEIGPEHFHIEFKEAGKEIMGYSHFPWEMGTYGHYVKKFEKELLPEIKEQLKPWKLQQLFK